MLRVASHFDLEGGSVGCGGMQRNWQVVQAGGRGTVKADSGGLQSGQIGTGWMGLKVGCKALLAVPQGQQEGS